MNAAVALSLLRGSAAGNRARLALTVGCIALGVALAGAVHTIHASALAEVDRAARALAGKADVEIRGPRNGFDEMLFAQVARRAEVQAASPIVDVEAPLANGQGTLRVLGIDPFRAARLQPGYLANSGDASLAWSTEGLDPRNAWFTPAALAHLGLRIGETVKVRGADADVELKVAGALPRLEQGGEAAVIDIAAAQELFGRVGRLSRIDLRLRPGVDAQAFRDSLALAPGVVASQPASISGRAASMTRAYRVNLNALALMALLTGMFLVFSTLTLQAARRREEYALLRALGVTRRGLRTLLALEGAIVGALGAAIGTVLGLVASRAILREFGSDLGAGYFRGMEASFAPDPLALGAIAAFGIGAAALGAWVVARAVGRLDIAAALRDRALDLPDTTPGGIAAPLVLAALGSLLLLAPPVAGLPVGGYLAIALWLAASVLAVGPACRVLLARFSPRRDPIAALAAAQVRHLPGHLAASVSGIVVSASLCAAMAVMVYSFRVSLDAWLTGVVGADLYARPALAGGTTHFTPEQQQRIARIPGVARVEALRYDRLLIGPEGALVTLVARPLDARVLAGFQAAPAIAPAASDAIAVWVSEAAVDLQGWRVGERIALPIAGRNVAVVVAGTYRDYARTWGAVLMDLDAYRGVTGDLVADDLAIRLSERKDATRVMAALREALPEIPGLALQDGTSLHEKSLAVFDRTFAATYALEAVAIFIALAGVTSSFAAIAWSRRREFGVLRHLGLTRREVLRMLAFEGAAAGILGAALGLASGAAISLVLVHVVNRQSFHWGMEVHWPVTGLAALACAIVALCAAGARWSARAAVRDEAVRAVKDDA
jgi:putative ABC transport system permease protein